MDHKIIKLPKLDGQIELKFKVPNKSKPIVIHLRREFMEELVADLSSFNTGDARARVSLSCDMSAKDFGNGAGVSVTISISCNQNEDVIQQVVSVLGTKVRTLAKEQLTLAGAEYNSLMESASQNGVKEWAHG